MRDHSHLNGSLIRVVTASTLALMLALPHIASAKFIARGVALSHFSTNVATQSGRNPLWVQESALKSLTNSNRFSAVELEKLGSALRGESEVGDIALVESALEVLMRQSEISQLFGEKSWFASLTQEIAPRESFDGLARESTGTQAVLRELSARDTSVDLIRETLGSSTAEVVTRFEGTAPDKAQALRTMATAFAKRVNEGSLSPALAISLVRSAARTEGIIQGALLVSKDVRESCLRFGETALRNLNDILNAAADAPRRSLEAVNEAMTNTLALVAGIRPELAQARVCLLAGARQSNCKVFHGAVGTQIAACR